MNRFGFLFLMSGAVIGLSYLAADISLLDDDWGHLKLASKGIYFALTTGWEGLVGEGGYYRPVVVLTFYFNYLLGGFDPAGYHVLNVLIHVMCAGLVFVLGRQLGLVQWVCVGGSALFLVLPIHTDSVFWIVGRTDTICALFYLGSLIVFLMLLDAWAVWKLVLLVICAGLAFLSKEMALSLPGLLLILAGYRNRLTSRNAIWGVGLVGVIMLMYFAVRWLVLGGIFVGTSSIQFSIWRWGIDLVKSFAKFGMTDLRWFGGVVLAATGILFFFRYREHGVLQRFLPFGLTVLCVLSLVPVLGHLHNWYVYIPSAFFRLLVADVWLSRSQRFFSFLFAILLLYYAGVLVREGFLWRETSQLSETFVAEVLPYAQNTDGRLFVLNTPSALTPEHSLSGKPLFAFALENALLMRSKEPVLADVVMVNHIWLMGQSTTCKVERDGNLFRLVMVDGGYFSFHNGQALNPPFELDRDWGTVRVLSRYILSVDIDVQQDDRVVFFDGIGLKHF
ncbi:MAG: hypothetical protein HN521_14925 [Candidatus Latescibacteria bacterium]|nr:hypothetical protein [Candidatus Latescibacterota bacterium]